MLLNKSEYKNRLDKAEEFLKNMKNQKALNYLNDIIKSDPSNANLWLLLGIANRRLGKYKKSIECFEKVTEFNTSMVEAWGLLTITYIDYDDINKAKESIEKAGKLNPNNEKIQFYRENLIRIYVKHGPFFQSV